MDGGQQDRIVVSSRHVSLRGQARAVPMTSDILAAAMRGAGSVGNGWTSVQAFVVGACVRAGAVLARTTAMVTTTVAKARAFQRDILRSFQHTCAWANNHSEGERRLVRRIDSRGAPCTGRPTFCFLFVM